MNKADGFGLHRSPNTTPPPIHDTNLEQQPSFWNSFSNAVKNTAQYASVEFDRFFETMGFKQQQCDSLNQNQEQEEKEQIPFDTSFITSPSINSPSNNNNNNNNTRRQISNLRYNTLYPRKSSSLSSSSSYASSSSLTTTTVKESRKRPFHHDNNTNNNDSMTKERAEKLRRINEMEVMLRELKQDTLLNDNNDCKINSTMTSPAKNITTRTTTMKKPSKSTIVATIPSVIDDDSSRIQRTRMDALEQRIEAIQAQLGNLVPNTTTTSTRRSSIPPSTFLSRPSTTTTTIANNNTNNTYNTADTNTFIKSSKKASTTIPIPPPAPTLLQPRSTATVKNNDDNVNSHKPEPEIPLPSPPPPPPVSSSSVSSSSLSSSAQSSIRHRRISTNANLPASLSSPTREKYIPSGGYKVLPSSPLRTPGVTKPLNKVPNDIHRSSMKEIVQQIPNVQLRRTDMVAGPDGSMIPNPFWVEIYEPKRRLKRSRTSMSSTNNNKNNERQQQNRHVESSPLFKKQRASITKD